MRPQRAAPSIQPPPPSNHLTQVLGLSVAVGVAYFLAARLGLLLRTEVGPAASYPAAGVAIGATIIFGRNLRSAIAAAIAIATVAAGVTIGRSPWLSAAFGLINAGQALLTVYLIERWFDRPFAFDSVRHVFRFMAAAGFGVAVGGVGGAAAMTLLAAAPFWGVWQARFLSGAVGIVVVAPLLIGLAQLWRERPSRGEWIEGVSVLPLLGFASFYTVTGPADSWVTFSPSALVLPFLLWLTARCPPPFAIAGAFIASFAVLLAITFGVGRFGDAGVPITERITGAQAEMTIVTLATLVLTALFNERRRNEAELKRAEEHQRMLVAELNHRVKNVLATVAAVASRTQDTNLSAADFAAKLAGRIQSMATTHDLISRREWHGISVRELVQRELAPYMAKNNADLHGPDLMLSPHAGQAVSMVLHELTTNAAKHGALSTDDGRVSVRWNRAQNANAGLCIEWQESGGPAVQSQRESGYGTEVIRNLIPYEIGGTINLVFASEGLRCVINIPDLGG
ncbi:MAG TPA: HWE histidine kinase domain-containing protein [Candidatus Saccharimonadales bacterium]|nr:HWE histidine kinase domain-containing protein [Candidatus Saccharimonadales bacterium]